MKKNEGIRILFVVLVILLTSCKSTTSIISSKEEAEVTTGVVASVAIDSTKTTTQEKTDVTTAKEVIEKSTVIIKVADESGELKTIRQEEYTNYKKDKLDTTLLYTQIFQNERHKADTMSAKTTHEYKEEVKEKKKRKFPFDWLEISIILAGFLYIRLNRR